MQTPTRIGDPDLAQARLQAWRSRRPQVAEWGALEAILGFDGFLARARLPPFARWVEGMPREPALHEIDRGLRVAYRRDCATIAAWYPPPWDGTLSLLAAACDLPALGHLLHREPPPGWLLEDPAWRVIAAGEPQAQFRIATGLDLPAAAGAPRDLLELWLGAWLARLPAGTEVERSGFRELSRLLLTARAASAGARGEGESSATSAAIDRLSYLFRRYGGSPVAMACELAASWLDLRRLRSGLLRRALAARAATVSA